MQEDSRVIEMSDTGTRLLHNCDAVFPLNPTKVTNCNASIPADTDATTDKWEGISKQRNIITGLQGIEFSNFRNHVVNRHGENESSASKLKDLEFENALVKTQLAEVVAMKELEVGDLKMKLGEGEYEFEKAEQAFSYANCELRQQLDSLHAVISNKDREILKLKEYQDIQAKEISHLKKRNKQFENYLADLPTADEFERTKQELSDITKKCIKLNNMISSQENKLFEAQAELDEKEVENKTLKRQLLQITRESISFHSTGNLANINEYNEHNRKGKDVDEISVINKRLTEENEKLKKFLQSKHQKLLEVLSDKQQNIEYYQQRLTEERDTITGLSSNLQERDTVIKQLQISLTTISNRNQEILEQNIELQELCDKLKLNQSSEQIMKYQQLEGELTKCVGELSSIIQICVERMQGKDPNLSLLLGLKVSSLNVRVQDTKTANEKGMENNISRIKFLQLEISKLRNQISDQYAEYIGRSCPVQ